MGWAGGSSLFSEIISALKDELPDKEQRKRVYRKIIDVFRDEDWDTMDECLGEDEAYDELFKEYYPGWDEEAY